MDRGESSNAPPYKELWKQSLVGQTIDAKLDSMYEGLEEVQKLIIDKAKEKPEQRLVRRRTQLNSVIDPTKPGYPSISNMVSTMRTIEELEQDDQANSSEEDKILEKINQLQLQCNMEWSNELAPDSAESGVRHPEPNPQNTPHRDIASDDEAEASRYRYRHEPTRTRRIRGRHLFPHPGHAYPLTNAGAILNIDCVTNTDNNNNNNNTSQCDPAYAGSGEIRK